MRAVRHVGRQPTAMERGNRADASGIAAAVRNAIGPPMQ
jgi:hypothetical protein